MLSICLTGGPCAGKSSALSILSQALVNRGYKPIFVPESPTTLILSGIVPGEAISMEDFQNFVLEQQLAQEGIARKAAEYFDSDKVVVIHDRGLCDQMAYVDKELFVKLLAAHGMSLSDAYGRYDCVIHLVSAAKGAQEFYQWNDPSKEGRGNNAARSESPEEAAKLDDRTMEAWIGHHHLRVIDNSTNFSDKIQRVIEEIFGCLGEPIPKEIERKFLIKKPTIEEIEALGCISETNIIQTYLQRKDPQVERRVRQRGTKKQGYNFYYTEKTDIADGERQEVEYKITPTEYINLMAESDTTLHQIAKTRYCFVYKTKYYELDIYPFSDELATLEIELNDINESFELPNLQIVREVTNDPAYRNNSLAKTMHLAK